ncbi:MAG: RsmB/NOP family class I SAM-dependent RNA methyltransferase [Flavobacteriaceae bacterium]|nr:RsmB/NOP family class I SAM-dependent RNA methyltransferase [Flavobacteriaceae bacterium]
MKRLHRNTAQGIVDALSNIFYKYGRATRVLEKINLANPRWGARDRNNVHLVTYEIIRWKNYYCFLSGTDNNLTDVPKLWKLLGTWLVVNSIELPNWEEFTDIDVKQIQANQKEKVTSEISKSIPNWLYERGEKELSEKWDDELGALNIQAKLILRVNRIVISPKKLQQELLDKYQIEAEFIKGYEDALLLQKRKNLRKNPLYLKGYFEIQDANSQKIAPFVEVKPGMKVIDGCAGAGGKTLHLASLMRNRGEIIALDIEKNKIKELSKRARRNNVKCITKSWVGDAEYKKSLTRWADRVLIDAPCSGLGTLKRNPELKWKLTHESILEVIRLQREILLEQSKWVKEGGKLIYATCSVLASENQSQIQWFLNQDEGAYFSIEKEEVLYAHKTGFDGFYAARLVRNVCG